MGPAALLERAAFQQIRYDERSEADYQRALVEDACAGIGCDPDRAARRWVSNRNADLWRIETAGSGWVLKILTSKPAETIECEYAHLVELHRVAEASDLFRVPQPVTVFPGRSAYLMRFVDFRPLPGLLTRRAAGEAMLDVLRACGRALAVIHGAWAAGVRPFDGAAAQADFRHLPWTPGLREAAALERVLARYDGQPMMHAKLYLDFDPVNVAVAEDGALVLLDPPERRAVDVVQWDLGVFLLGLRRVPWRRPLAARHWSARLPDLSRAFATGYASEYPGGDPGVVETGLVPMAELARLGQLWRWWLEPLGFRRRFVGLARAAYAWPLLRSARRRVIAELAQAG